MKPSEKLDAYLKVPCSEQVMECSVSNAKKSRVKINKEQEQNSFIREKQLTLDSVFYSFLQKKKVGERDINLPFSHIRKEWKQKITIIEEEIQQIRTVLENSYYHVITDFRYKKDLIHGLGIKKIDINSELSVMIFLPIILNLTTLPIKWEKNALKFLPPSEDLEENAEEKERENIIIPLTRFTPERLIHDIKKVEGRMQAMSVKCFQLRDEVIFHLVEKRFYMENNGKMIKVLLFPILCSQKVDVSSYSHEHEFPFLSCIALHVISLGDLKELLLYLEQQTLHFENLKGRKRFINHELIRKKRFTIDISSALIVLMMISFSFITSAILNINFFPYMRMILLMGIFFCSEIVIILLLKGWLERRSFLKKFLKNPFDSQPLVNNEKEAQDKENLFNANPLPSSFNYRQEMVKFFEEE